MTLRREWDDDACGILKNEKDLGEIFTDFDLICREIDMLIEDDKYLEHKRKKLNGQVITEQEFNLRLKTILENPSQIIMKNVLKVDTHRFLQTYKENITLESAAIWMIDKECNLSLICRKFPGVAIIRAYYKLVNRNNGRR